MVIKTKPAKIACLLSLLICLGKVGKSDERPEIGNKSAPQKKIDALHLVPLVKATKKTAIASGMGGKNVVVIEFSDDSRKAYNITDDSEIIPAPEINHSYKYDRSEEVLEELRKRIEKLHKLKELGINDFDAHENLVVTVETKDGLAQVSHYDRVDLRLIDKKKYSLSTLSEHSMVSEAERETSISLSENGRWLLLESGISFGFREAMLINTSEWTVEGRYQFDGLEGVSWGYDDKRLIVVDGCFCEGEDGRSLEIYDIEGNLPTFKMTFNKFSLGPHDDMNIGKDHFWIAESDRIHFWDLVTFSQLAQVPVDPPLDFHMQAMTGNTRFFDETFSYNPFVLLVRKRSDVIVARSDDKSLKIVQHRPKGSRVLLDATLPPVLWMEFTNDHILLIVTINGAIYSVNIDKISKSLRHNENLTR